MCSLKIWVDDEITDIRGNNVGNVITNGKEKIIYFTPGTKHLELFFKNHFPVKLATFQYKIHSLASGTTYILKLGDYVGGPTDYNSSDKNNPSIEQEIENAYINLDYKRVYHLSSLEPNNPTAQNYLGLLYLEGREVKKNEKEAFKLFKKSAEAGNIDAIYNLGYLYAVGKGVKKNWEEAYKLLKKAADEGSILGMINFAELNLVNYNYSNFYKYYKMAADNGSVYAMNNLGYCLLNGIGTKKNKTEALELFNKAAQAGEPLAFYNLGCAYETGFIEADRDYYEALKWYHKAAALGVEGAQKRIKELEKKGYKLEGDE